MVRSASACGKAPIMLPARASSMPMAPAEAAGPAVAPREGARAAGARNGRDSIAGGMIERNLARIGWPLRPSDGSLCAGRPDGSGAAPQMLKSYWISALRPHWRAFVQPLRPFAGMAFGLAACVLVVGALAFAMPPAQAQQQKAPQAKKKIER